MFLHVYRVCFFVIRQNPKDIRMLAQLISAYSVVDTDKAKSYPFKPLSLPSHQMF